MKTIKLERTGTDGIVSTSAPEPKSSPQPDLSNASPETIKDEIARTRAHMDEHLSQLGRKFRPRPEMRKLKIPFVVLISLLAGFAAYGLARSKRKTGVKASMTRFKIRTAGMRDHIRTLQLVVSVIRKGKPAILIVEPPKS